jgi:hypothetical protein
MQKKLTVRLLCLLMIGCTDEEFVPAYQVPEELQHYVDTFIYEGSLRGETIEINNLIIRYDSTIEAPVCANCNSRSLDETVQKIISITTASCWVNDQELETLIFHELGHCYLGREHDDGLLPNGDARSIMTAKDISVYSPCIYQIGNEECDRTYRRAYYLDELFEPATPVPSWGN